MTPAPLADREIVVGVSGGIAAYKAAHLVSLLVQRGAGVSVVMTRNARRFVGPATFAALSGRPVAWRGFDPDVHPLGAH
ncbi:MAG: flavoprotein, partial [Planctomycetaceae bacterium]